MAFGDQFLGIMSLAERLLPVDNVVNLTENGPFKGPPIMHQFAPHKWFISSHSSEFACHCCCGNRKKKLVNKISQLPLS